MKKQTYPNLFVVLQVCLIVITHIHKAIRHKLDKGELPVKYIDEMMYELDGLGNNYYTTLGLGIHNLILDDTINYFKTQEEVK